MRTTISRSAAFFSTVSWISSTGGEVVGCTALTYTGEVGGGWVVPPSECIDVGKWSPEIEEYVHVVGGR